MSKRTYSTPIGSSFGISHEEEPPAAPAGLLGWLEATRIHPDAAMLSVVGRIDPCGVDPDSISSSSHPIVVKIPPAPEPMQISLNARKTCPDRDLVVTWKDAIADEPLTAAWVFDDADGSYAFVRLRAPRKVAKRKPAPLDLWILLDHSGSMAGGKWSQSVRALHRIVEQCGKEDRLWLMLFDSFHTDFAEKPLTANELCGDRAFQNLELHLPCGGTDLLPAFKHLLKKRDAFAQEAANEKRSAARREAIVIITDGQVGNEEEIIALARNSASQRCPIHCIGIDTAVNDAFLRSLARVGGGICQLLTPHDDIAEAVSTLAARLGAPVLIGLKAGGGWTSPGAALPDLHEGESIFVTLENPKSGAELSLTGRAPSARKAARLPLDVFRTDSPAPRLLCARERIETLIQAGDSMAAVDLAVKHGIFCRDTSFIAIDEAERVPVAQTELYQPSLAVPGFLAAYHDPDPWPSCHAPMPSAGPPDTSFKTPLRSILEDQPLLPAARRKETRLSEALPNVLNAPPGLHAKILKALLQHAPAGDNAEEEVSKLSKRSSAAKSLWKQIEKMRGDHALQSILVFLLRWACFAEHHHEKRIAWLQQLWDEVGSDWSKVGGGGIRDESLREMIARLARFVSANPPPGEARGGIISALISDLAAL